MGGTVIEVACHWRCAGASVIGTQHERVGGRCEDAWSLSRRVSSGHPILGICVSDGAGSARCGAEGATTTATFIAELLTEDFDSIYSAPEADVREYVCTLVVNRIREGAGKAKCQIRDYACTVVAAAVAVDGRWVVIHLGDGGVVGLFGDELRIISRPKKGNFVNETFFITDSDAVDNLSILRSTNQSKNIALNAIVLFTDGVESSLVNRHSNQVAPAIHQMLTWLYEQPESAVAAALSHNLKAVFRCFSGDDCTLVLAVRGEPSEG